jgi:hypothetical protein
MYSLVCWNKLCIFIIGIMFKNIMINVVSGLVFCTRNHYHSKKNYLSIKVTFVSLDLHI